jgi:hypothetical protein
VKKNDRIFKTKIGNFEEKILKLYMIDKQLGK